MTHRNGRNDGGPRGQDGFALLLAIMSLLILTFLGLTLTVTTSTELQIATNYRWGQQAYYNAEAGIEAGKALLRNIDWDTILWTPRTVDWMPPNGNPPVVGAGRPDEWGNPARTFEMGLCDERGAHAGYGVVLDDGTAAGPYQYKSTIFGQDLNGAFTLWVRRRLISGPGGFKDSTANDQLVLTAEGVAPFHGGSATSAFGQANRAVRVLEFEIGRQPSNQGLCGTRGGQAGGGPDGAGFAGCDPITSEGVASGVSALQ